MLLNLKCFAQSPLYGDNTEILEQNWEPNYFTLIFGLFLVIALIYLVGIIYQKLVKIKLIEAGGKLLSEEAWCLFSPHLS